MGHPVMLAVLKNTTEGTLHTVSDLPSLIGKDMTGHITYDRTLPEGVNYHRQQTAYHQLSDETLA